MSRLLIPILILVPVLGACATGTYRLGLEMLGLNEATVEVPGFGPEVQVVNEGPGLLHASFDPASAGAAREVFTLAADDEITRKASGKMTVWLWTAEGEETLARVNASGASGLHILRMPLPRRD